MWGLLGADRHTIGGYHDRKGAERGANDLDKNCTGVQTGFFCLWKCVLEPGIGGGNVQTMIGPVETRTWGLLGGWC